MKVKEAILDEIDAYIKSSGIDVQNLIPNGAEDIIKRFSEIKYFNQI